jgi:hypothetical protein
MSKYTVNAGPDRKRNLGISKESPLMSPYYQKQKDEERVIINMEKGSEAIQRLTK